jgi:hypothetical protein
MNKCLPVLENVPPVAFVIQDFRSVMLVMGIDGKPVPGPAGISVSSAELQRQIFKAESPEKHIIGIAGNSLES